MEPTTDNRLELRIDEVPGRDPAELRLLVDGVDLLAVGFDYRTTGPEPDALLGAHSPLLPGPEPREVRLRRGGCGEETCCGALYVTVRREGGAVCWEGWRNPGFAGLDLPGYRFDAGQYLAEVERAGAGVAASPARSVGRLLEAELVRRPELLAAWECEFQAVWTERRAPDRIDLLFHHPPVPDGRYDLPQLQFMAELTVPAGGPEVLAAELLERIAATDPRTWARICGGSARSAELLGYPWPEDL
ncbi:hypothetical protein HUT16_24975 [Kitasatospora sp. NA04385]|uniref:hypothetical protein n=1 Tax=Kitasatospora sp. NA04385 TaxID=2742135 RepID=UPI00159298A3|nr:hypothetical protein [Kitasatospora sp. NA04385]QKW21877.1 hypothetical protein HUT16_24975 [Kitasatospora sp. NA04385]